MSPSRSSSDSSTHVSNQSSTHYSCRNKRAFGLRHGSSTVDQVALLTQYIEDGFSATKQAAASFVDVTAAWDTVWHRSLTCKLLRLLADRYIVRMFLELVFSRSFTLTTGNNKRSRLPSLKNFIHRDPFWDLFSSTSLSDLLNIVSRKYAYAVDLAVMHADGDWQAVEGVLSKDMATVGEYLQTCKLKPSTTKMVSVVFHLNRKLNVS